MFFMSVVVLAVGFLFLIRGADFFVEGSAALAPPVLPGASVFPNWLSG